MRLDALKHKGMARRKQIGLCPVNTQFGGFYGRIGGAEIPQLLGQSEIDLTGVFLGIGGAGGFILFFAAPVGGHRKFRIPVAPGGLDAFFGGGDVGLGGLDLLLRFDQTLNRFIKRIRLNRSSHDKGRGNKGRDGSEGSFVIMTLIFFSVPLLHKQHHVPRNL